VKEFQREFAKAIDFHIWVQFELDFQKGRTIGNARQSMPIGVCADLPLAPSPSGADTWGNPGLFAGGAHIGAPPDDFSAEGQDWGLSPITPHLLHEDRYQYWIGVVKSALRHAGALRIDHVMGLFRQFWIPAGQPGSCGAYVRYPAADLLGILALESARSGALIIGEDLGTVPAGLQARLARWGILSTRVLYFERDKRCNFRPARRYSKRALVTAHTHDQVPVAGFWNARDLELRRDIGTLGEGEECVGALSQRARERTAITNVLLNEGVLKGDARTLEPPALSAAIYDFLARTPAPLLGVSLDDLAGETDPVNIPGVTVDRYPAWSRRMSVALEALPTHPTAVTILEKVDRQRGHR
jgi:4-alpha-glucanotransferase